MRKQILVLMLVVLLLGLVSAEDRTLYYPTGIDIPVNIIAGNTFGANFSFQYLDDFSNPDNSPLIIQLNFSSVDENYPVWRNDFKVSGRVEKYALWGYIHTGTVYFECNNSEIQIIEHPLDIQTVQAGNGTFYCYDELADLKLEEHDKVYLNITSHQALYPGAYNLIASMFYLTDERVPFVNITNKNLFDRYYRENDNVLVLATIDDASEISEKWASVTLSGTEIFPVNYDHFENDEYYFSRNTPVDIVEDDYKLFVFAKDEHNNTGNDSVTLKIDRTAPEITLVSPVNNSVVSDIIPLKINVTDEKSGTDNQSVYYRLREIVNGQICPDIGVPLGNYTCTRTDWINLPYNPSGLYEEDVNTTELNLTSGEYWLDVKAQDILGNENYL